MAHVATESLVERALVTRGFLTSGCHQGNPDPQEAVLATLLQIIVVVFT